MGIQINGQTDTVTSTTSGGSVKVTPAVINATGVSTFTQLNVGTGGTVISTTASGLIGVGIANPGFKLEFGGVAGTAGTSRIAHRITGSSYGISYGYFDEGGGKHGYSLDRLHAGTLTEKAFVIRADSGYLGIGTDTPSQKLEVVGGEIKAGRVDTGSEGGQVSFGRSTDNATAWYLDVYGSTSTPDLRFVDVSNGLVRATIDGSGRVTKPYQPYARVYYRNASNVTYTSGTSTTIIFNDAQVNTGSCYSTSTGRFTCPVAGVYLMMSAIEISPPNTDWTYNYLACVNGSSIAGVYEGAPAKSYWAGRSYAIVNASANDYLTFILSVNASVPHEINPGDVRNYAMFYLLG